MTRHRSVAERDPEAAILVAELREVFAASGIPVTGKPDSAGCVAAVRHLCETLPDLRRLAADGERVRAAAVAEALRQGVRRHGRGFDEPRWRARFDEFTAAEIRELAEEWRALADAAARR